ncbi:hypothetical protein AB1E18_005250 [Capra hircus]
MSPRKTLPLSVSADAWREGAHLSSSAHRRGALREPPPALGRSPPLPHPTHKVPAGARAPGSGRSGCRPWSLQGVPAGRSLPSRGPCRDSPRRTPRSPSAPAAPQPPPPLSPRLTSATHRSSGRSSDHYATRRPGSTRTAPCGPARRSPLGQWAPGAEGTTYGKAVSLPGGGQSLAPPPLAPALPGQKPVGRLSSAGIGGWRLAACGLVAAGGPTPREVQTEYARAGSVGALGPRDSSPPPCEPIFLSAGFGGSPESP